MKSCIDFVNRSLDSEDDHYELCFLGDFNLPDVDWLSYTSLPSAKPTDRESSNILFDFIADRMLSQYVLKPTRENSILDIFLTNSPNLVTHVEACDTPLSDHRLIDIPQSLPAV